MDLQQMPLFKMIGRQMNWLSKRQEVLAHNIANSDTPKYRPHDLKELDFSRFLRPQAPMTPMAVTNTSHMEAIRKPPRFRDEKDRDTYEVAPAGNSVVLEEQLMKVQETQAKFRLATNLYTKHIKLLKSAIGYEKS
jgi:flagellar basal-body rod protein FlgB